MHDRLQALTGSHRLAAARLAQLEAVPCYVVDVRRRKPEIVDEIELAVMDYERVQAVSKLRDDMATKLMIDEGRLC
jgi:hypothetical protein